MIFEPLNQMLEGNLSFSQAVEKVQRNLETVIMVNTGATVIPFGCPDCDGDLLLSSKLDNNMFELKCKTCNSIYLVTMVGGKYESNEC